LPPFVQLLLKADTKYYPMHAVVADSREIADSLMIIESVPCVCTHELTMHVSDLHC
jgi:hypothetical protein